MKTQRILTLSLRIILVFLVLLAGAVVLFNRALNNPKMIDIPTQVAGLVLTRSFSGQEAAVQVNTINGEDFTLTRAQVGYYGEDESVVIRVGGTPFAGATGEMLAIITTDLNSASGDLQLTGEQRDRGRSVYLLEDQSGQAHLYFQSERYLVWFSGPPELAEAALSDLLNFYP
jgi:hypothetical protein